jgi:hypothetical protein
MSGRILEDDLFRAHDDPERWQSVPVKYGGTQSKKRDPLLNTKRLDLGILFDGREPSKTLLTEARDTSRSGNLPPQT